MRGRRVEDIHILGSLDLLPKHDATKSTHRYCDTEH